MITRRQAVTVGAFGTLAASSWTVRGKAKDRKPNLVFILADDHAGYVFGAQGNRRAITPEFGSLCRRRNALCQPLLQRSGVHRVEAVVLYQSIAHASGVTVLETPLAEDRPTLGNSCWRAGTLQPCSVRCTSIFPESLVCTVCRLPPRRMLYSGNGFEPLDRRLILTMWRPNRYGGRSKTRHESG